MKSREPRTKQSPEKEAPPRGMWSGTVSFSLVAIPVQFVRAVDAGRISFRMLHSKDYSPLVRKMFCTEDNKIVPPEETIRGFEIAPDKYILVSDEELESISPERSRTIEIIEFIDLHDIDPLFFDHPYYLLPSKGGEKAYQLLVEVMARTNKAGIAKFVLREREYPVVLKSTRGALTLITLHYNQEVLPDSELLPKGNVDVEEKGRMKKVIAKMRRDFEPEKYADTRRKKIRDLLERKIKEKALVEAPEVEEEEGEGPADLIAALKESMAKVKKTR